jgi:hypothetical protein
MKTPIPMGIVAAAGKPAEESQVGVRYHAFAPFGLEFTLNYLYQRWGGDDGTSEYFAESIYTTFQDELPSTGQPRVLS